MQFITTTDQLKAFCQHIWNTREASENFITIDTEFQREKTYYPTLCLIQVATATEIAVIDPLAEGIELTVFWPILQAPEITKVFHAGRQDIEIFYLLSQQVPAAIFDTQIAAMVCGFGESVGYETLVQHYVRKELDKSLQKADWRKRPLSQRQLDYAANDVRYLREVYRGMCHDLTRMQRWDWFAEELQILSKPETYTIDEDQVWRRLKIKNGRPEFLARLQAGAKIREQLAKTLDLPRSRVIADDALVALALLNAPTLKRIPARLRQQLSHLSETTLTEIIQGMTEALQQPKEHWPTFPLPRFADKAVSSAQLRLMEYFLEWRAEQLAIVPRLLATREELNQLLSEHEHAPIRLLKGWRYDVFGREALALAKGEIALKIEGQGVKAIPQNS